jgi:hypothetical protein
MQGSPGQRITQHNPGTTQPGCGDLERCLEYVAEHRFSRAAGGGRSDFTDWAGRFWKTPPDAKAGMPLASLCHISTRSRAQQWGRGRLVTKRFQRQVVAFSVPATAGQVFPKTSATCCGSTCLLRPCDGTFSYP